MQIKSGVRMDKMSTQILLAILIADKIYRDLGNELVLTSITDSTHKKESLHYSGNAVDFRTNFFTKEEAKNASIRLVVSLGDNYDVILEVDHIHVEFDPH